MQEIQCTGSCYTGDMTKEQPLRGVNLGGWLVLEKWITPSLFRGTDARDEYTLMQTKGAARKIAKHRKSFITEADFAWLAENGVNAVRIPVGYWLFDGDEPYTPTVQYLDWAIDMAEKYNLKVLIDLHGAKGSQNGEHHSGRRGKRQWHRHRVYRQQTISVLEQIAERYYSRTCVWGIELLNEPKFGLLQVRLRLFYAAAYRRLLSVVRPGVSIVFSDAFSPWLLSGALSGQPHYPVVMDVHWYQFGYKKSWQRCVAMIRRRSKHLARWQGRQPVIIGEWSGALSTKLLAEKPKKEREAMVHLSIQEQLRAYEFAAGWFYWTYKLEERGVWNFRSLVEDGVINLK